MHYMKTGVLMSSLVLMASGCDGLFDVTNPGSISGETLERPEMLNALLNLPEAAGAENFGQFVWMSALIGEDFMEPGTCTQRIVLDRGMIHADPSFTASYYDNLAADQWHAAEATRRIREFVPNPDTHPAVAKGYFWDGVIMLSRADLFEGVTFDGGPLHTPVETYKKAVAVLEKAVAVASAAGEREYHAAAYGTMARAERSLFFETGDANHLARAADFAAKALAVKPDFRINARYASSGRTNVLHIHSIRYDGCTAVGERFHNWTDPVSSRVDPRVNVTGPIGTGPQGRIYQESRKAANPDTPISVSRWQEAELIIAEHLLQTQNLPGAVARINRVRTAANLPAFQSSSAAAIRNQLIYERKTEFYLEGRSWQDHRYYKIFPDRWSEPAKAAGLNRRLLISDRERTTNENLK